jgi:hypothetical protein
VGTAALGCPDERSSPAFLPMYSKGIPVSTRTSIWLGENRGKCVHIYWELADREIQNDEMTGVPIYIAVEAGNV